jgi:class 3 adenylate cyclase
MGATCCGQSNIDQSEIGDTGSSTLQVNLSQDEQLLRQLLGVENDQGAQDLLAEKLGVKGCCLIASMTITAPNASLMQRRCLQQHIKVLLDKSVWPDNQASTLRLVKADGPHFYVYASNAAVALKAAVKMQRVAQLFPAWFRLVLPAAAIDPPQLEVQIGIADGALILMEGDMYGDPVNTSSKLGQDLAKPGEIFVSSAACSSACEDPSIQLWKLQTTDHEVEVSKVTLKYTSVIVNNLSELVPIQADALPALQGLSLEVGDPEVHVAVMVTDLSGFTSLTKKYGILHFLRLVLQARHIFVPLIAAHKGKVVKYEGDNIIAIFPDASLAVHCIKAAKDQIQSFNVTRDKDFQMRMGISVDCGEVVVTGHDVMGRAFDHSFHLAEEVSEAGEVLICSGMYDLLPSDSKGLLQSVSARRETVHPESKVTIAHHIVNF